MEVFYEDFFTDGVHLTVYATVEKAEKPTYDRYGLMDYPGCPETVTIYECIMTIDGNSPVQQMWRRHLQDLFNLKLSVLQRELFCTAIDPDLIETTEEKIGRE